MKNMRDVLHDILSEDLMPADVLRAARIQAELSQDELQEITGIARSNISALENGRSEMTFHYALIFAAALKVHPSEILFPKGKFQKTDEFLKIEKKAQRHSKKTALG